MNSDNVKAKSLYAKRGFVHASHRRSASGAEEAELAPGLPSSPKDLLRGILEPLRAYYGYFCAWALASAGGGWWRLVRRSAYTPGQGQGAIYSKSGEIAGY